MTLLQGLDPALECGCVWDSVLFQPLYWLLSLVWECSGAGGVYVLFTDGDSGMEIPSSIWVWEA